MRRHAFFLAIFILAAASGFFILFHSQTHVHSDESIIGLMGKHILDGRQHFVIYMYGQDYNAAAAWEAYLAAASFALFGVGVVPLKACILLLSLVCLACFYWMACTLFAPRTGPHTAALAALVFALSPSLLKWHFQVRGYSFYFLSLPILTALFLSIDSRPARARRAFLFGLLSGLSMFSLELVLPFIGTLWLLLGLRRKLSLRSALAGAAGFLAGYAPAILFNFTHHFSNWRSAFLSRAGGLSITSANPSAGLFHSGTLVDIFLREMPKFFGPDTVLWYYPETPVLGWVLYLIALLSVAVALWPFLRRPSNIVLALRGQLTNIGEDKDFLMLALIAACFVPYVVAPSRVPGYFLGGYFFLAVLMARLVERCLVDPSLQRRLLGVALITAIVAAGVAALVEVGAANQIETLTLVRVGKRLRYVMVRIPGRDIDAVESHLRQNQIATVWTSPSFVYPLIFESRETLAVSSEVFGGDRDVYPDGVPRLRPTAGRRMAVVIESDSPYRPAVEASRAKATGAAPVVTPCGALVIIE
ncbi:MAG: hypothetical protein WCA92_16470 [Terriglobales bacterium]|jgi:hypothetical protein